MYITTNTFSQTLLLLHVSIRAVIFFIFYSVCGSWGLSLLWLNFVTIDDVMLVFQRLEVGNWFLSLFILMQTRANLCWPCLLVCVERNEDNNCCRCNINTNSNVISRRCISDFKGQMSINTTAKFEDTVRRRVLRRISECPGCTDLQSHFCDSQSIGPNTLRDHSLFDT